MTAVPLVSVLIPAYNHERYVQRCLDSVLQDAYPRKELVVIDDGSTDGTADVISDWIRRNSSSLDVRFCRRENRGISRTLNELGKLASGEFLRVVASDDFLLPAGIAAQVSYLQQGSSRLGVFGDAVVVDGQDHRIHESLISDVYGADKSKYLTAESLSRQIICRWSVGGPVLMIRKAAFEALEGWNEELSVEDWDIYLRLLAVNGLGFVDLPVGAYRLHGSNTSRTQNVEKRIRNLRDMEKTARRCSHFFEKPYSTLLLAQESLASAKISFLQRRYLHLALDLLKFLSLKSSVAFR
ncbi:glycosyltransferase family 2 protein [Bradyrhizobium sp. McL0616]|uniref:glycosyltransferase family 2 protein n=1 Tax=Bradyrhizobium sp. McL0616 TaxID=3415674 RepID=UPI003CEA8C0C